MKLRDGTEIINVLINDLNFFFPSRVMSISNLSLENVFFCIK